MESASKPRPASAFDRLVEVYITEAESPEKLFFMRADQHDILRMINGIIQSMAAQPAGSNGEDRMEPLMQCIARYNGNWYRAVLISAEQNGRFLVCHMDYGTLVTVNGCDLRPVPNDQLIRSTKPLAKACRLSGDHSRMDANKLRALVANYRQLMWARIDDEDEDIGQLVVTLYYISDRGFANLNEAVLISATIPPAADQKRSQLTKRRAESVYEHDQSAASNGIPHSDEPFRPINQGERQTPRKELSGVFHEEQNREGSVTSGRSQWPVGISDQDQPDDPTRELRNGTLVKREYVARKDNSDHNWTAMQPLKSGLCQGSGAVCGQRVGSPMDTNVPSTSSKYASDLDALLQGDYCDDNEEDHAGFNSYRPPPGHDDDQDTAKLRRLWSAFLGHSYPRTPVPAAQSSMSEQQCKVAHVNSPSSFYIQTTKQIERLSYLEAAMGDVLSSDQNPIPFCLLTTGTCCAVLYGKSWKRGRVMKVHDDEASVELVDYGLQCSLPLTSLKPLKDHFITHHPPSLYHVCLEMPHGFCITEWSSSQIEDFKTMVNDKLLTAKIQSSDTISEVKLTDFGHSCRKCYTSATQSQVCSVNYLFWKRLSAGKK